MNPVFLDDMSWAMAIVYEAATDEILMNMARHLRNFKPGEKLPGAFEYQARKLAEMGQVNRETLAIMRRLLSGADAALGNTLEAAIVDALTDVEPALRRAAARGMFGGAPAPPPVSPRMTQTFRAFYQQAANRLNLVNTVMLESTESAWQQTVADITNKINRTQEILNTAAGNTVAGVDDYNKAMKQAVGKMVDNRLTGFVDHAGHHWTPEAYVAMDIRATTLNTSREAFWEREGDYGDDLYYVSTHDGARPLCYPWQAKVISRAGPHRWVTDGDGKPVQVWAQSETSYGEPAGLFGINCRHFPLLFVPGVTVIRDHPQPQEINDRIYQESQQQRALERELRRAKLKVEVEKARGASEDEIKAARAKERQASADIRQFCEQTGRKRRPEREYRPVNATWPDKDSYNAADFPTAMRDMMRGH